MAAAAAAAICFPGGALQRTVKVAAAIQILQSARHSSTVPLQHDFQGLFVSAGDKLHKKLQKVPIGARATCADFYCRSGAAVF